MHTTTIPIIVLTTGKALHILKGQLPLPELL